MPRFLKKWLAVYDEETALFGWTVLLLLLVSAATIIFNNYAETAFLKRFGVKHLPVIYMLNSALTFVVMGLLAGVMARWPGIRLLSRVILVFGISAVALRAVVPWGFTLLYPLLYILKAQYAILLGLLFWNLANDLFNTRQAKRLFPLITAGGVIGTILGSAATPVLAALISMDNLILVYGALMGIAALVVVRMGTCFPILLTTEGKPGKNRSRPSVMQQFREINPLLKQSSLVGVLILLTLVPNVIIPVLNYQFNFAVDSQFATEGGLVRFFGYFRSFMSAVSLLLLLFVSRAYSRWGLPVALMFHPLNYLLVFIAFLLRFDVFSAMYARLSTTVIRTTLNKPVTDILMGVFPAHYRTALRPFLRGTIVRVGLFTGSGIILIADQFFHPRYLSLAMLPCVAVWIGTTFYLKRHYAAILAGLLAKNMVDLKSLEAHDARQLFRGRMSQKQLMDGFLSRRGPDALWYAQLLKSMDAPGLDDAILAALGKHADHTRIPLLGLLSDRAGGKAVTVLAAYTGVENQPLAVAALRAITRLKTVSGRNLCRSLLATAADPEIKALAAAGCLDRASEEYRQQIDAWLGATDPDVRLAGIIGIGESGSAAYRKQLDDILRSAEQVRWWPQALKSLGRLRGGIDISTAAPYLQHPQKEVRLTALEILNIEGEEGLQHAIALLGDPDGDIRSAAQARIESAPYQNGQLLIGALNDPDKTKRTLLFELLGALDIRDHDLSNYAREQIEAGYRNLSQAAALRAAHPGPHIDLLADHVAAQGRRRLSDLMRVVSLKDGTGRMRAILRSLFSTDTRQQANAREALEDIVERHLLKLFLPLVDGTPTEKIIARGRRKFNLPDYGSNPETVFAELLNSKNWITVVLALHAARACKSAALDQGVHARLNAHGNPHIRRAAARCLNPVSDPPAQEENPMETEMTLPDKILHLKKIDIFRNLPVTELSAIASIAEESIRPSGGTICKKGDKAEAMYLVIKGEVAAYDDAIAVPEVFASGESLGGIVLLTDDDWLFSARATRQTHLLIIHKHDFIEIVREYPQIALDISKLLCEYVKELWQQRARDRSERDGNSIFNGPAGVDRSGQ